ncbi:hypothetical protein [Eubacterium ramulus]
MIKNGLFNVGKTLACKADILESEEGIKAHHNAGGLPEDMASCKTSM